jgi:multidrug efflux pump subunit AcrA (membrane-fusion protein)
MMRACLFALGVSVAAAGCAGSGGAAHGAPPAVVDVVRAVRGNVATYATFDGQVAPLLNATLSSPQSGNVTAVYANEGDRVRQGELLAKIDDASLRDQLAQARGELAQAQGRLLGSAISQPIQSMQYGAALGQARATVDADEAALLSAKAAYDGNARLYPQGYVAQTTFEQSRAAYVAAQRQLDRDQAALAAAKATVGQSRADIQNVEANRGTLEQMRATVRQLQTEIAQTQVRAPFDGLVVARLLDPGGFASSSQPILAVAHTDAVYVDVNIPDDALAYVHPGTNATFTTTSLPGKVFDGKIADINTVPVPGTLSYRARIRRENPDGALRGGMLVDVVVCKQKRENVVVVPRAAIIQGEGGDAVFAVRAGKAARVAVKVGLQTDTRAEVLGVKPGENVVVTHPEMLQDGAQVAIDSSARGMK